MDLQEGMESLRIEMPAAPKETSLPEAKTVEKPEPIIRIEDVDFYYGDKRALKSINLEISEKKATAFIGPSGCGKTTLLRCLNRMNDLILNTRVTGNIKLDGKNIYDPSTDIIQLRRRVGMIFQKWNPFPKSIYENVVYGLRIVGINNRSIPRRGRREELTARRLMGRGQRQSPQERRRHVRRTTTKTLYRPGPSGGT